MFETQQDSDRLLRLKRDIVSHFTANNWLEVGAITGSLHLVQGDDRLLRAMRFGDDDYADACFRVLLQIISVDPINFERIEHYISQHVEVAGTSVSSSEGPARIYFTPTVFEVPNEPVDKQLVSAMMPFVESFTPVFYAIEKAAQAVGLSSVRADNIWSHSVVVQDVFSLIYRSEIVLCDFTGKNANVFYEAGIAHTLGKHVVPITQHADDIPFDLRHHRYCQYLNNEEGRTQLTQTLADRFRTLSNSRNTPSVFSQSGMHWTRNEW